MPKRKRLNKRFVVLLVCVGAVAAVGASAVVILLQPRNPEAYAERAAALLKDHKYAEAVDSYRVAVGNSDKQPKQPDYLVEMGKAMLEWLQTDRALSQSRRGELFREARAAFQTALRLEPKHVEAMTSWADTERQIAQGENEWRYWQAYIEALDRLLALVPDDHSVLFKRAQAKAIVARSKPEYVELALADYQELLRRAGNVEGHWLGLAGFYAERAVLGDSQPQRKAAEGEAEKTYKQALEAIPDSVDVRVAYSAFIRAFDKENTRAEEARKLLTDAIDKQPKNVFGYLAMADYCRSRKEVDEAIGYLDKAEKADPTDFRSYAGLANLYGFQRSWKEAEAVLTRGLERIRQSAATAPQPMDDQALRKHREAVMSLDHLLCDVLLDQISEELPKEQVVGRVQKVLEEMRTMYPEHPLVHKIIGRLALVQADSVEDLVEGERLLRAAYEEFSPSFDPKTAGLLINVYRRLNQLGEAQKIVERFLYFAKDNPGLLLELVRLHVDSREYVQAEKVLQEVQRLNPQNELLPALKAGLEAMTGKSDRIPADLKQMDAYSLRLFYQRAEQLWLEGKEDAAVALAGDLLTRDPKNLAVMNLLIRWHRERKEQDKALAVLEHARRVLGDVPRVQQLAMLLEPDEGKRLAYQLELLEKVADPFEQALGKAEVYRVFGKEKEFLDQIRLAESKNPKHPVVVERLFDYALGRSDWQEAEKYARIATEINADTVGGRLFDARLARARGQWDDALRLCTEALDARPRFSEARAFRGDCYFAKEQFEQAQADYQAAYELNPSNVVALIGMINVSERIGTQGEQEHWVNLAYRFLPTHPAIRSRYLSIREAHDRPEEVIQQRENIRKSQPGDLTNLARLAALYEKVGKLNQAEQVLWELYQASKASPSVLRELAGFLRRTGRDLRARELLVENVKNAADKAGAYLLWAEYLEDAGEVEQARGVYDKALEADTDGRAYARVGQFAARRKDYAEAVRSQQEYLRRAGKNAVVGAPHALALYQINAGQFDEAQKVITGLLEENASDYEALSLKGFAELEQGRPEQAIQSLDRALSIRPNHPRALRYRAQAHYAAGNTTLAAADLETARRGAGGTTADDALRLVDIYSNQMGDFASADAVLQSYLASHPNEQIILRARVELCLKNERWAAMAEALTAGRKAFPQDPYFPMIEAQMWRKRREPAKAVAPIQELMKLSPPERQGGTALQLAEVLLEAKQFAQAAQICTSLREDKALGAVATAMGARALAGQNRPAEAENAFAAALKAAPEDQLLMVLRQITETYGPDQSVERLKGWLALRPGDWYLTTLVGELLMGQHQYRPAIGYLQKALEKATTDQQKWEVHRDLGVAYDNAGQVDESRKAYQTALELNPRDAETLNNLAWLIAQRTGRGDEALPYAERASRLMPNDSNVLDTYGLVLYLRNELGKAHDVLNRSIAVKATPANRLHLGQVYEKMDRKEDALRQYRLGWELVKNDPKNPRYEELRQALIRLGDSPGTQGMSPSTTSAPGPPAPTAPTHKE